MSELDRVSYTFGVKLTGPKQYESTNISFSYSSDVARGESLSAAEKRVAGFVESVVEAKMDELREAYADVSKKR